jgi:hypothetical protein
MNIIELAKQAGLVRNGDFGMKRWEGPQSDSINDQDLKAFAALVAAQEREACAALCFSIWNEWLDTPEEDRYKVLYDAEDCAAAIRARGTT